jgi:hypothetical protein
MNCSNGNGMQPDTKAMSPVWWKKILNWFRVKKLQFEIHSSRRFQKECEDIECFALAENEKEFQAELSAEIKKIKAPPPE